MNVKKEAKKVVESLLVPIAGFVYSMPLGMPILKELTPNPVYVFGNGGSGSIANHLACDWMKGTFRPGKPALKVISLASNTALITAIANDMGYDETCSRQLQWLGDRSDVVILISSSGTSKNIVRAAEEAKRRGSKLIGFTGNAGNSNGGQLREWADVSVHCDSVDYGTIEDFHSNVMHEVARQIRQL